MKQVKMLLLASIIILFTACGGGSSSGGGSSASPVGSGESNSFEKTLTLIGGSTLEVTLPSGASFTMPAIETDGDITKMTIRSTKESYDFGLVDEDPVASILEVEFDSFSPDNYGVEAMDFIPQIIIPKSLVSDYDINTLSIFRVSDMVIDGKATPNHASNLPITELENGDLIVSDYLFPNSVTLDSEDINLKIAGISAQTTIHSKKIRYVVGTFRDSPNWNPEPILEQFFLNSSVPEARSTSKDLSTARQNEENDKNITNIIVFVHGHNETEKVGKEKNKISTPWLYPYKRDVWTKFYKNLESDFITDNCTAFYEFIYPTYRPIFTSTKGVDRLDKDFAKSINDLVKNLSDSEKEDINLYIVAHSMGGLVARAGIQLFEPETHSAFKKLVTWGSPHWGSSLVTLRYLFAKLNTSYTIDDLYRGGGAVGYDVITRHLDSLAIDSPGERELRRANHRGVVTDLTLYEAFSQTPRVTTTTGLEKKYNLFDGTWLYNEKLKLLNENDVYKESGKYHAIYGITTRAALRPIGSPNTGAYLIGFYQLTPSNDRESDGSAALSSLLGGGVVGGTTNVGDIDHEEYFNDPTAARVMYKKTLDILQISSCDINIPTIPTLEWDNYPQPQWCPLIAKIDNDGDCPWIEKNINLDDGSNILVDCIYNNTYRSTECVGNDKCTLIIERPYLDLTDDDYHASSLLHGWWKEYSVDEQWDNNTLSIYLDSANRYYMHEYKETKDVTERVWDCK